jgi:hypothetical protein
MLPTDSSKYNRLTPTHLSQDEVISHMGSILPVTGEIAKTFLAILKK